MPLLIAFRGVQGVGGAMIFATNIAMLIDTFPANMRGRVLGIATAMVYIGASLGPVIGGFITHQFGWRSVLMLITALSVCAFIIAIARLPKEPAQGAGSGAGMGSGVDAGAGDETKQRLGPVSVILYIVSVVLVLYGFTTLTQNIFSYIALGAGAVLLVLFVRYESTAKAPVVQIRLFRGDPNFLLSNLAALLNYSATFAVSYLLSIYLQLVAGYAADVSGLILIAQPIVQAVVAPIAGRISDRRSPYLLASAGMALCAATLFILIFVGIDTSLPVILAALMIAGVGIGLFSPSNTNAIMSSVQPRDYGSASSLTSTMRTFGQVFAMAIITIVMNFVIGNTPIAEVPHEKIVESMHTGFIIFCAICAVGIFISLNRKKGKGAVG
jgi:MFS family permease